MKLRESVRFANLLGFLLAVGLLCFAYYLQHHGFTPCPLCLLQRMALIAIGMACSIGMLWHFNKLVNIILSLLATFFSLSGMLLAARQVWLQYAPPATDGGCGVSLQYLLSILPITDVIKMVWQGGTECSELGWVFLHLSMAEWSLIFFGVFFIGAMLQLKRSVKI